MVTRPSLIEELGVVLTKIKKEFAYVIDINKAFLQIGLQFYWFLWPDDPFDEDRLKHIGLRCITRGYL